MQNKTLRLATVWALGLGLVASPTLLDIQSPLSLDSAYAGKGGNGTAATVMAVVMETRAVTQVAMAAETAQEVLPQGRTQSPPQRLRNRKLPPLKKAKARFHLSLAR